MQCLSMDREPSHDVVQRNCKNGSTTEHKVLFPHKCAKE